MRSTLMSLVVFLLLLGWQLRQQQDDGSPLSPGLHPVEICGEWQEEPGGRQITLSPEGHYISRIDDISKEGVWYVKGHVLFVDDHAPTSFHLHGGSIVYACSDTTSARTWDRPH